MRQQTRLIQVLINPRDLFAIFFSLALVTEQQQRDCRLLRNSTNGSLLDPAVALHKLVYTAFFTC